MEGNCTAQHTRPRKFETPELTAMTDLYLAKIDETCIELTAPLGLRQGPL